MPFGTFLTENILTLLAFDEKRAPVIRGTIGIENFGGQYKEVATRLYDYIDKYQKPAGDHLPDILEDKLTSSTKREAQLYEDIVTSMHDAYPGINAEYVMTQVGTFVSRQSLRSVAVDLTKALQRDTEEGIEEAQALIAKANTVSLKVFDRGLRLNDVDRVMEFLDQQTPAFPTGIPELDKRGFGPTRKELLLYIADTKKGKTWFLIQLAKMAVLQRLRVLHVTLEMSEQRSGQRYLQALFALAKRPDKVKVTKFARDKLGRVKSMEDEQVKPKLAFNDVDIKPKLRKLLRKWSDRLLKNIIVKEFPTGQLTLGQLDAYLQNLEATEGFIPDLLIMDYPDLMKLDASNVRASLDEIYKGLRGLGVKRNMAVAAVSQSHRAASKAKQVEGANVAEAYSKIAHSDTVITYSQTEQEKKLGLARLTVVAGRNDEDRITIIISQQYGIGQFALDSSMIDNSYWQMVERNSGVEGEADEED